MHIPALASRGWARPCVLGHKVSIRNRDWLEVGVGMEGGCEARPKILTKCASDDFQLPPSLSPQAGVLGNHWMPGLQSTDSRVTLGKLLSRLF